MDNVIWKAFKLGDLFEFSSANTFALKNYNLYNETREGLIEVVTSSKDSEKNQFISASDIPESCPIYEKNLTINRNGSIGYCLYHDDKFIIPTGDSYALLHKNEKFEKAMNIYVNSFLSTIITHLFTTTVFGWSYKVNSDRFARELILLPCLEVGKDDEYIWEENGHYYTLAVEYIKHLMDEAKELREQKTIRLYEAERAKYEAERAKYEAERAKYEEGYEREKKILVWKGFRLGDFLSFSSSHVIKDQIKNLQVLSSYEEGTVANVTASKENNGIVGYIEENEEITKRKQKSVLTIASDAAYAGVCFYQPNYVVSTGHNKVIDITLPNLKLLFEKNKILYMFLASIITRNFCKTFYGFSKSITDNDFKKTLILLPCLEVGKDDEYIWEENGYYYTLAVEYISYIYLTGKMENSQKKIDNYTYQY